MQTIKLAFVFFVLVVIGISEVSGQAPGELGTARLKNGFQMRFSYIPAGSFQMGDGENGSVHTVAFRRGFWMGRTEVTQAEWYAMMGNNPSKFSNCTGCPVEQVSWDDARQFVSRLNAMNDGYKYSLPTEAEWEYASRAGTTENDPSRLDSVAWYGNRKAGERTHPVGQKSANAWGLFDTLGNVDEWVQDKCCGRNKGLERYSGHSVVDPVGDTFGPSSITRGGNWSSPAIVVSSTLRNASNFNSRYYTTGFRVVRKSRGCPQPGVRRAGFTWNAQTCSWVRARRVAPRPRTRPQPAMRSPRLSHPKPGAVVESTVPVNGKIRFVWIKVKGASKYLIEVQKASGGTWVQQTAKVYDDPHTEKYVVVWNSTFPIGDRGRWRVGAFDPKTNQYRKSTWFTFRMKYKLGLPF